MGNQLLKYVLILIGMIVLLTGSYLLLHERIAEKNLAFDMIVCCMIYFANIFAYPILYSSSREFSNHIAGLGISIFFTWIYTILGIGGIVGGIYFTISFEWQLLYQLSFFLIYLFGVYIANIANSKINNN